MQQMLGIIAAAFKQIFDFQKRWSHGVVISGPVFVGESEILRHFSIIQRNGQSRGCSLRTEGGKPLHTVRRVQGYGNLSEFETDSAVCTVASTVMESTYLMMPMQEEKTVCGDGLELSMN